MTDSAPLLSVVMANYNGATHIGEAVRSVLGQTEAALELIVSDDCSSDDSLMCAQTAANGDPRLVIVTHEARTGPAGARNRALKLARGRWIAVVDNDDVIEPERLERLVASAEADGADIAADNLLVFYESESRPSHPHLPAASAHWVDAAAYARSNILLGGGTQLGYLKPVFRRSNMNSALYDESLTIGEDSDLVLRLLVAGARMRVYPELGYRYRKHAGSISHRLNAPAIDALLGALDRLAPGSDAPLRRALERQRGALLNARAFSELVAALKARDFAAAWRVSVRRPGALLLLKDPILARLPRRS